MYAAGIRPYPARHAFRDQFRALWLITDEQFTGMAKRIFPEWFGVVGVQMVKIPQE